MEWIRERPVMQGVVWGGVLVVFLVLCYGVRDLLFPFVLAAIVAYVLDPLVEWFRCYLPLHRSVVILLLFLLLGGVVVLLLSLLLDELADLTRFLGDLARNPPPVRSWIRDTFSERVAEQLLHLLERIQPQDLIERGGEYFRRNLGSLLRTIGSGSGYAWNVVARTVGVGGVLVKTTVFFLVTFYLLRDFHDALAFLRRLIPPRYRTELEDFGREINHLMKSFFQGHFIVSLTIGILYGLGYMIVGLEGGFVVGLLSGVMNVVPYLGPSLGFLLAFLMGLFQFGSAVELIWIVAVFVVVQSLEGNVLTPNIVGEAVGLNPMSVIFALMLFGKFLGFFGLLVAIPLAAVIKALLTRLVRRYKRSRYYLQP